MVNMMEENLVRNRLLESRMTRKQSCPVWRGAVGKVLLLVKVNRRNSLAAYSTACCVLRGLIPGNWGGLLDYFKMLVPEDLPKRTNNHYGY